MEELSHYGPSLSVKFHENCVYAGYGPWIYIYDFSTGKEINKCRIFHKNKVHHISISNNGYVLVCGMRSLSIVKINDLIYNSSLIENERMFTECITSGEFSYDNTAVYILTCYNEALIIDMEGNVLTRKAVYGERSILYSGSIKVRSQNEVYINAGTVMGGVLIWELFTERRVHNLLGHVGSIFFVTVSNDCKYIASCSDDRSIRLWDFASGKELSIGWGHTARIWQLKFYNNNNSLISISEDCTCRVWSIISHKSGGAELIQQNIFEVHLTKNAWSVDVHYDDLVAVTSGNDGRIKVTDLKQHTRYGDEEVSFSLQEISKSANIALKKEEIIKGFQWFDFGLVAITSQGNVLNYNTTKKSWKLELTDPSFISYGFSNGLQDDNIVIFSNNIGDLLILKFNENGGQLVRESKFQIKNLSKVNNCMVAKCDKARFLIFLESPNPRDKLICLIINTGTLTIEKEVKFSKPENFVSSCIEVFQDFVLVGSRFSTLAIYDLRRAEGPYVLRRINPGDTTTSIKYIETVGNYPVFSLTNRDGYYNFIKINFQGIMDDQENSIVVIHSNKIIKGFLEYAYMNEDGDYIIHGFKSNLFYIYNETKGYEIANQICGGAHRQWKLCNTKKGQILVYVKASNLFLRVFHNRSIPDTLRDGIHGREIRDITIRKQECYNSGYLFCTASEDTSIKLCHVDKKTGAVTTYWTQRKHVSGLQRCSFVSNNLVISSSAREELFLWEINTDSSVRPYMNLRQVLPTSSTNPDLRIMDFSVQFVGLTNNFIMATVYSDSSVKIWFYDMKQNRFNLVIDGKYETCCLLNVRLVQYSKRLYVAITPTDGNLVLYNVSNHLTSILREQSDLTFNKEFEFKVITLPEYDLKLKIHQSGIKAIDHCIHSNGELRFYTGGDDNALGICKIRVDEECGKLQGEVCCINEYAAASTITSCELIINNKRLITTSVDQVVRFWNVNGDGLKLENEHYVTVADTGSSDAITTTEKSTLILIGGVGLSVLKLPKELN